MGVPVWGPSESKPLVVVGSLTGALVISVWLSVRYFVTGTWTVRVASTHAVVDTGTCTDAAL